MQTTYKSNNSDINLTEKINNFKKILKIQSFILLARPKNIIYESDVAKKKFIQDLTFIINKGINNIDAICNHGHTIFHKPESGITYQLGNLPELSNYLENIVVCDFRIQDVEMGGQGAPLVPIGDELLFSQYDYCINLGGFSNVSFKNKAHRVAFDICPTNIVLNYYSSHIGLDFDNEGKLASQGELCKILLNKLLRLWSRDFFSRLRIFVNSFGYLCRPSLIHYSESNRFRVLSFIWIVFFDFINFT